MTATVATVAYLGLEARAVEVQVQLSSGLPAFIIVGLPDKAVAESRERVRAALAAIGLALPPRRITVNLSRLTVPSCEVQDEHPHSALFHRRRLCAVQCERSHCCRDMVANGLGSHLA